MTTDKARYVPGETVRIAARLENTMAAPVVVARFIWDGGLTATSWFTVKRGGAELNFRDDLPQVILHDRVQEERFATIAPGSSVVVRELALDEHWDLNGADPSLKDSWRRATPGDLPVGTYQVAVSYTFGPGRDEYRFEGDARSLYERCATGSLAATCTFEVVADPASA
ncbi:MAG: hypothetical protein ACAI25_21310, partial [Planctomycetota bacterium]